MKNKVVVILVFALIGLVIGYLVFAKIGDHYLSLKTLFNFSGGDLASFGRSISGIKDIQQKILISGLVGVVVGFIYTGMKRR